jgi:HAE1 family hydrophobic/amphiphilic exporter-1
MISKFFIERPVLANVIAILIVILGAVAMLGLPVAQYPNVVPPTVSVTARYPGASAKTVMDTVALPIEQQVNGVENMLYMQSTSASDGSYSLTVTFAIGTDLNFAQVLVQNRVSAALAQLPASVQAQGVVVQQKSTAILQVVALSSPDGRYDSLFLSNYAVINLVDELARLPGVGNVVVFGAGSYAMRIWMDPNKLKAYALTPQDVIDAIKKQSSEVTAGQLGLPPAPKDQDFQYTLNVAGRLTDPSQFANIIVKVAPGTNGQVTRVKDIGRVELGAQTYSQTFEQNGKQGAGIAIYQLPGANALQVATEVRARMAELAKSFPQDLTYNIPFDTTLFVAASIHEVYKTLIEAAILVLIVILVFLQDWRAMLVPATTVPVTIIGAFAAMAALGFSVNLSTLFAIVLAIGIVVDDAIVIVEAAAKNIEEGLSGHDAAIKAMNELLGPIIGITLVLMSVFVPAAFLPGLTGRIFAQFALVIAATALISAVNAATLKPTQCAQFLGAPVPMEKRNAFYRAFNAGYAVMERLYVRLIGAMVHHALPMVILALAISGVAFYGMARLPTGFLPIEDQGYVLVAVQLPDASSLGRTQAALQQVQKIAAGVPGVDQVFTIGGISVLDNSATLSNAGVAYVILKDWSKRGKGEDLRSIYNNLNAGLSKLTTAASLVLVPPPIQGIGNTGGFTMMIELRDGSNDFDKLGRITGGIIEAGNGQTGLQRLTTTFRSDVPQLNVEVNRIKAEALHVTIGQVFSALSAYLGSTYVNQFNQFGQVFQVYVQADADFRTRIRDIDNLTVVNREGETVPLGTLVNVSPAVGPSLITLYNLYPAATLVGSPAPGFSSGQAMTVMEQLANQVLPPGTGFDWTAMSYQEKIVGNTLYYVFALAVLLVYLVLAGQYESWTAPISVILAVPLALLGPFIALSLVGAANNLYTQIGLILLIALASKNAILIVEVAREHRQAGMGIAEAAIEAARIRFRPILMTSFAFILGVVPLVVATGAGAASRRSIGITVFSGMIASTCLAVLFVPSFFMLVQRYEERSKARKQAKKQKQSPAHS